MFMLSSPYILFRSGVAAGTFDMVTVDPCFYCMKNSTVAASGLAK